MSKLRKGKLLGIAAACLLVASLAGALVAPAILAQEGPSVSIVPEAQDVVAGNTFTIDVLVDAADNDLMGIDVEISYDGDAMTTSEGDIETHNDLLGPEGMPLWGYPKVTDGEARHAIATLTAQAGVDGSLMTITFTMDAAAAPGDYGLTITVAGLADENVDLVVAEINDGTVTIPDDGPPPAGPSVSIDPETQDVVAGNTFTIDVLVDAADNDLMGIDVEISYNGDAMTTSEGDIEAHNDLLGPEAMPLWGYPKVTDGEVRHAIVNPVEAQAGVEGLLMTIEFAVNEDAVPGDYDLTVSVADLLDENGEKLPDVAENDGVVTVLPAGPEEFDETFSEYLARGERDYICPIPAGAYNLAIDLTTAGSEPDMDLELYDGDTLVIGYGGEIRSATGGTYEDDEFGYSGYRGGEEYITADGPLGQAYDLMVYGYQAGTYTVDVYYEIPEGVDVTPPEIDIVVTASIPTVGEPLTVTVTADDPSGVAMVMFMVSSTWPGGWSAASSMAAPQQDYEDIVQWVMSFDDEASVTFVPGWAGTYTVDAWAVDNEDNMTPEGDPVTDTFVVLE